MKGKIISEEIIERFKTYLYEEEKSENTKEKYIPLRATPVIVAG